MERSRSQTMAINSQAWWDKYFSKNWDQNNGRDQTKYFMELLLEHLSGPERGYLEAGNVTILDWGCAFGDGVNLLARAFPACDVSGLDFSRKAIQEARRCYPNSDFIHTENGKIPRPFDVIVCSNCLEHFDRPLDVVEKHLNSCKMLYVVLVPFDEHKRIEQHHSSFTQTSFPEEINGFSRLLAKPVASDPKYWRAMQLLVIYRSESYPRDQKAPARTDESGPMIDQNQEYQKQIRMLNGLVIEQEKVLEGILQSNGWQVFKRLVARYRHIAPPGSLRARLGQKGLKLVRGAWGL